MNWPCRKCIERSADTRTLPQIHSKFRWYSVSQHGVSHIRDSLPAVVAIVLFSFRFSLASTAATPSKRIWWPSIFSLTRHIPSMLCDTNRKTLQIAIHLRHFVIPSERKCKKKRTLIFYLECECNIAAQRCSITNTVRRSIAPAIHTFLG